MATLINQAPPPYTAGTVSGAAGQEVVTGTGTAWIATDSNGNSVAAVFPGDLLVTAADVYPIMSVDTPTQITLEIPLKAALSGAPCRIRRYLPSPTGAVLAALQQVLSLGTDANPEVSLTIDSGTGRAKLRALAGGGLDVAIGASGAADAQVSSALQVALTRSVTVKGDAVSYGSHGAAVGDGVPVGWYSDAANLAARTPADGGTVYLQGPEGVGTAKLSVSGDAAIAGAIVAGGNVAGRDGHFERGDATGAVFLGDAGHYLYWDGHTFSLQGGPLTVNGQAVQPNLGFVPVQQGGGAYQGADKVALGWDGSALRGQVNSLDIGRLWYDQRGPASLGTSGYQKLPSGLIIQWGQVQNSEADYQLAFPVAFPVYCMACCVTPTYPVIGTLCYVLCTDQLHNNYFVIRCRYVQNGGQVGAQPNLPVTWIAIGY